MSQDISNARKPEQVARMEKLQERGACFFCDKNYVSVGASPSIRTGTYWYVKRNDFPYEGAVEQYLVVPYQHVTRVSQMGEGEWRELLQHLAWLEHYVGAPGGSFFVRQGDPAYTGASLAHLHVQYLVGGPKPQDWKPEDSIPITLGYKVR